ncbi:MAG: ATP-binding protein [bacterium]
MKKIIPLLLSLLGVALIGSAQNFEMVWQTDQILKTPESVAFDAKNKRMYVSNVNGKPLDKDGNGFISVLNPDGSVKQLKWVTGMHAPKGMAFNDSILYVTDIDRFHMIDLRSGKIVKTVDVKGAKFLNDMALNPDGTLYISDMQSNHILSYDGTLVTVWLSDAQLVSPNGLNFYKGNLYIGAEEHLLKINPADMKLHIAIENAGPIDGLICLGGNKFVVSDWAGRVMLVNNMEKIVLQNTTDKNIQAADLGYIPDEKLILIPTFFDNRVVAKKLP